MNFGIPLLRWSGYHGRVLASLLQYSLVVVRIAIAFAIVGFIIRHFARRAWQPFVDAFPPRPDGPGAVRRVCQTCRIDQIYIRGAIAITADQDYLHMEGWGPLKYVSVPSRISIAWDLITVSESHSGRTASIGEHPACLPDWCLEIAAGRAEQAAAT